MSVVSASGIEEPTKINESPHNVKGHLITPWDVVCMMYVTHTGDSVVDGLRRLAKSFFLKI